MTNRMTILFCATALTATACTTQRKAPKLDESPRQGAQRDADETVRSEIKDPSRTPSNTPRTSDVTPVSVAIAVPERDLQAYALDTKNLTYSFTYLSASRSGDPIVFTNGSATITLNNLEKDKSGDLTLRIVENSIVKLSGVITGLTLRQGQNRASITLAPVAAGAQAGKIQLEVTIGNGGGNGPNPGPTPTPGPTPNPTPGPTPVPTPPPGPIDPNAVSFARDIKPLTDRYCSECHHPGKAVDLSSYAGANSAAMIEKAITSVESGKMPPTPRDKMPANALEKLRQWKAQGMNP